MSRYELDLRLDAPGDNGLAGVLTEESERVRTRVYRKLGLKAYKNGWVRIQLNSDRGRQTIGKLIEECGSGIAAAGAGSVTEHLDEGESVSVDWFYLITKTADRSFSLWDDYPSYKPGGLPPDHALNHTFVSAAFVEAYGRAGLRGLSFLRCQNKGRKHGSGWFVALPDKGLGHGLDHQWFDRSSWIRDVGHDRTKRFSSLDAGQSSFHQRWLRRNLGADAQFLTPLLELFPMTAAHGSTLAGLRFVTVPRFWAKVFPDADFAYVPWGEDGPNREGKIMRFRLLMVGRKARRALIDAGLFSEKAFLPVRSVAVPEEGVEILDERFSPVPPMYTAEELDGLRAREMSLFAV